MNSSHRTKLPLLCSILLLLGGLGFLPRADATLVGTQVDISFIIFQDPDTTELFAETVTVIDPGQEVVGLFDSLDVDIGSESIRVDITAGGAIEPADFTGFQFLSLEWVGTPGVIIGFLAADTNIADFDVTRLLFDVDAVAINLQGLTLAPGGFVEVTLDVRRQVPEPSTLWLLLAGAGLMGGLRALRARPM